MSKLRSLSTEGKIAKWIENLGRQQRLVVDGTTTKLFPVTCRVPVGQLLFVIFISSRYKFPKQGIKVS